jgi:hypothetical protein
LTQLNPFNDILINTMDVVTCPICLDVVGLARVMLACGHVHCVNCFAKWCRNSNRCSCCRAEFSDTTPHTVEKVTTHPTQIDEMVLYSRSVLKNVNYEKYNKILYMSIVPMPDSNTREAIERLFNELVDANTHNMACMLQNFYENN